MSTPAAPTLAESWLQLPDGRLFWLKGRCAVGRQVDNDLVLEVHTVSRHHALLTVAPTGYVISDLHSSNGTYVNRTPVTRPTPLCDGDEVHFGDAAVRYRCTRRTIPESVNVLPDRTRRLEDVRERACWLLLADVAGFSALNAEIGSEPALRRFKLWIVGMRPLIEQNGGTINSYVGDAIFAWWPCDTGTGPQVRATLDAIARWRGSSPVPFRVVVHHGSVLFTRSDRGEELSGQDVNFVFRSEKTAKRFDADTMLSEAAVHTLHLDGKCLPLGAAVLEGMTGRFVFFVPPFPLLP